MTPDRLTQLVTGLPTYQLTQRPSLSEWSTQEVVAHLADAEVVLGVCYRRVLAEPSVEIPTYDEKLFTANLVPLKRPVGALLEGFRAVPRTNILLLGEVPDESWARTGKLLERLGGHVMTIRQMVEHNFHHDENHLNQIERVMALIQSGQGRTS